MGKYLDDRMGANSISKKLWGRNIYPGYTYIESTQKGSGFAVGDDYQKGFKDGVEYSGWNGNCSGQIHGGLLRHILKVDPGKDLNNDQNPLKIECEKLEK